MQIEFVRQLTAESRAGFIGFFSTEEEKELAGIVFDEHVAENGGFSPEDTGTLIQEVRRSLANTAVPEGNDVGQVSGRVIASVGNATGEEPASDEIAEVDGIG